MVVVRRAARDNKNNKKIDVESQQRGGDTMNDAPLINLGPMWEDATYYEQDRVTVIIIFIIIIIII